MIVEVYLLSVDVYSESLIDLDSCYCFSFGFYQGFELIRPFEFPALMGTRTLLVFSLFLFKLVRKMDTFPKEKRKFFT